MDIHKKFFRSQSLSFGELLVCFSLLMARATHSYPDGAGDAACANLTPDHGEIAQNNSASPFSIRVVGGTTTYVPGTAVKGKVTAAGFWAF